VPAFLGALAVLVVMVLLVLFEELYHIFGISQQKFSALRELSFQEGSDLDLQRYVSKILSDYFSIYGKAATWVISLS